MADSSGRGDLYLGDGEKSWPVAWRIQTRAGIRGRIDVTGTLDAMPRAKDERTGPIVQEISDHASDPNAVLTLDLKTGGQWVYVRVTGSTNGVLDVGADSHMIDAPAWAQKGGA